MIIRPAAESDVATMSGLVRNALSFASCPDPYAWDTTDERDLHKRIRRYLHRDFGVALVVEVESHVVGFTACHFDELDPKKPDRAAVVDLLAVAQEQRGRGLGTHLIEELKRILPAHQATRVDVNVVGTNEAAVRFWRRAGFHDIAVRMSSDLISA